MYYTCIFLFYFAFSIKMHGSHKRYDSFTKIEVVIIHIYKVNNVHELVTDDKVIILVTNDFTILLLFYTNKFHAKIRSLKLS